MGEPSTNAPLPQRLGDFEIVRELGRGGMGIVYEARQISLNRKVALKVLGSGLGLTAKAVQRFRREAEAAARLHHTNIVPVYATGEQDGTHFYAMELIDGPSLDRVLRQLRQAQSGKPAQPLPAAAQPSTVDEAPQGEALPPWVEQSFAPAPSASAPAAPAGQSSSDLGSGSGYFDIVARMIAEVADALDYAHSQGVIHRDIKPSNLLLAPSGRLSVNDFGLARMLEQPGMTLTGEFVGTPKYMSPEQVAAGRIPLDHRTDIYSLGATLYELLTLRPPFSGGSRDQVLAQILQKDPRPPRKLNKKVPVDLETICLKALDKDPDRRYQSAGQMAEDLRRYVNRFAISARRVGPVGRLLKWMRRRPGLAAALACAGVAVLVAAFFAFQAHEAEQRRQAEQDKAQEQLVSVMRERALEQALAAAMGGDLDRAEKAISEAEAYGASTQQVRMLRGLVAYHRGDIERALVDLEQAVKLAPDSVAAQGMLAVAYNLIGDWERYEQTLAKLEALSPSTAEDYLFKGYAQLAQDPAQALQTLNEAVKRSGTPLARAIRAEVRVVLAMDRADLEEAERAVADLQTVKEHLADNPYVLALSVIAQLVAANLYREAEKPQQQQAALQAAERDALALEPWEALPYPFVARWEYFQHTRQEPAGFAMARRAAEQSDAPTYRFFYALALYRRGQFHEAREVLERRKWKELFGDYLRACILAELQPKDRTAYEELAKRYTSGSPAYYPQLILRLLGDKDSAVAASRALRQQGGIQVPLRPELWQLHLDYSCQQISEMEYRKVGDRSRIHRVLAQYTLALTRLAEGDRDGAREHFRQAVQTGLMGMAELDMCRSHLAQLEKEPAWPPWIPLKK